MRTRERVSLGLEALLWTVTLGWLVFLFRDLAQTWSPRSAFEIVLLGLLVWWPLIRHRIKYGKWL